MEPTHLRMQKLMEQLRAKRSALQSPSDQSPKILENNSAAASINSVLEISSAPTLDASQITDKYGNAITLNDKQMEFVHLAGSGQSAVLIGAAGTGKTTTQKATIRNLVQSGLAGILSSDGHSHLPVGGVPGIIICAYTRRATANIRRNVDISMQGNCITIHKLLEYQPVYHEVYDEASGEYKTKMSFEATRNAANPLPSSIRTIILEESSMIGFDLFQEIVDACPHNPQFIFLGDIQQLPPVFGAAILGFKLLELPVIELTEVYRQALESPIIALAHRILSGKEIKLAEFPDWKGPGLTLHPWKKQIAANEACLTAGMFFKAALKAGKQAYDPDEDIILIPFNKSFGTDELNKIIANQLAHDRGADVYEVIAGFNTHYFSVGDKILYDKLDAVITKIEPNPGYTGRKCQHHSPTMDYWGYDPEAAKYAGMAENDLDVDLVLSVVSSGSDERVAQCSHKIHIRFLDDDRETSISKAAEVNATLLGYCLTVHKAQGSEWRKVFVLLHNSHNTMIQRELLYTAITRAREELYVICEPDSFVKGINGQRIIGETLAEKAEFFKGKKERMDREELLK
jgi:ATP-dependent exoDNAse (exonuclease V) alpha subunit